MMGAPVQLASTNLNTVAYDPDTSTLEVEFHSGGSYTYQGVTQDVYDGLLAAPSAGRYFHANIRDRYRAG